MNQSDSGFLGNEVPWVTPGFEEITLLHESEQGYSRLYKAKHLGKWFVLKCLKTAYAENPLYQTLLRKEFEIGYLLSHPHIVQTIGWGTVSSYGTCIVLEYVDGMTLHEYLKGDDISYQTSVRWIDELCQALSYIHAKQIVHRDLKPENILITANGHHVKLIDFGFSDADNYAVLKEPAGTRHYAAPEQMKQGEKIDGRSDIYALGIILKECGGKNKSIRAVARKCCQSEVSQRPSEAASIPVLINKHRYFRRVRKILIVILVLLMAVMGYYQYRSLETKHHLAIVAPKVITPTDSIVPTHSQKDTVFVKDTVVIKEKVIVKEKNEEKHIVMPEEVTVSLTIDDVMGKRRMADKPQGAFQQRWLLKDYVDAEMDKILIPWLFHIYKIADKEELQTFLLQESDKEELFLRIRQKVLDGYFAFIARHPLAEIDAEQYRPLLLYYLAEHYEEVRRFYRPMFDDKERGWKGLAMDNLSIHERMNHALRGIILCRLQPHLHHCDTMQHHASLRPITMEEWKTGMKTDAQHWLMSRLSTSDAFYQSGLSIIDSTIEQVHRELHGGRIRLAEKEARFRVME